MDPCFQGDYDPALGSDRDWVRFFVGDRGPTFRLDDREIDALLAEEPNKYLAAARAGRILTLRAGGLVEKQVGDLRLRYDGTAESAYGSHLNDLWLEGCRLLFPSPRLITVL